jgi:hypothetical protein
MAARPNYVQDQNFPAGVRPRLADDSDCGGMNPSLSAQRQQLNSFAASDEPQVERYSGPLRLAIIIGGSAGLWAMAAAGALRLLAAL